MFEALIKLPVSFTCYLSSIVVFCCCYRDAVSDLALHFLNKMKILVVRDIERDEIEFICKVKQKECMFCKLQPLFFHHYTLYRTAESCGWSCYNKLVLLWVLISSLASHLSQKLGYLTIIFFITHQNGGGYLPGCLVNMPSTVRWIIILVCTKTVK